MKNEKCHDGRNPQGCVGAKRRETPRSLGAVREGSLDRLNPILMTALTSALALIPLVVNADKTGNEIQSPMAVVVLGGLVSSTLLNIFVIPILYEWFETKRNERNTKS